MDDFEAVVFMERQRNNETKIETAQRPADGSRIFTSKFLFRSVGSRIRYLLCCHGPGYCVLGTRAGIIPDTSDGDV